MNKKDETDVLGIVSLCLIVYFPPAGLVVGLIGASKAKKEGYSPILSRIGWIANLAITSLALLFLIIGLVLLIVLAD